MTQRLVLTAKPFVSLKPSLPLKQFNSDSLQFSTNSTGFYILKSLTRYKSVNRRVHSIQSRSQISSQSPSKNQFFVEIVIPFGFSLILLILRLFAAVLLPDFPHRWQNLVAFSEEAGARTSAYPSHLWEAVVAYEDRRFFTHFGVDPVGIARAVISFSTRGGGSTISQQLVKNTFLRNERTLSRKIVEMVLSVALERTLSKQRILSCYISKIYWGHGIYGIEAASNFYFGKHPSLLTLGESALLVGIIPAPELRSPFKDPCRGKLFQARVLKRMVDVGFLDVKTAVSAVKQSLPLHLSSFLGEGRQRSTSNTLYSVWDWQTQSKIWEICEDVERWAIAIKIWNRKLN